MGEADHAMLEPGQGVVSGVLAHGGGEGVQQIFRTLPLLSFWEQTGQCNLQNISLFLHIDPLHDGGGGQILLLLNAGAGIDQVPQPAGNALRPQGRVSGQNLVIIRVSLDVRGVHGVEGAVQTLNIVQNRGNSLRNCASVQIGFVHSFL